MIPGRLRRREVLSLIKGGNTRMIIVRKKPKNRIYARMVARRRGIFFASKLETKGLRALMIIKAIKREKIKSRIVHKNLNPRRKKTVNIIVLEEISTLCIKKL
jgi:hypothetical protein